MKHLLSMGGSSGRGSGGVDFWSCHDGADGCARGPFWPRRTRWLIGQRSADPACRSDRDLRGNVQAEVPPSPGIMKYLKSLGVGLGAAAVLILAAIAVVFARLESFADPGVGAIVSGRPIAVAALLAFAGGFGWEFRRLSRRRGSV